MRIMKKFDWWESVWTAVGYGLATGFAMIVAHTVALAFLPRYFAPDTVVLLDQIGRGMAVGFVAFIAIKAAHLIVLGLWSPIAR
jgi:hypothetical protein